MVITVSPLEMAGASQCKLPVFEPVRARVTLPLLARRNVEQLASILSLDPTMTAELLATANQPKYGHVQRVYTAAEAIRVLGWAETEHVIKLAFDEQVKFKAELQALIRAEWAHSLACAVAAAQVAHFLEIPEERAFAFGMLHNIGAWD